MRNQNSKLSLLQTSRGQESARKAVGTPKANDAAANATNRTTGEAINHPKKNRKKKPSELNDN